jgi:hypothetical protein
LQLFTGAVLDFVMGRLLNPMQFGLESTKIALKKRNQVL